MALSDDLLKGTVTNIDELRTVLGKLVHDNLKLLYRETISRLLVLLSADDIDENTLRLILGEALAKIVSLLESDTIDYKVTTDILDNVLSTIIDNEDDLVITDMYDFTDQLQDIGDAPTDGIATRTALNEISDALLDEATQTQVRLILDAFNDLFKSYLVGYKSLLFDTEPSPTNEGTFIHCNKNYNENVFSVSEAGNYYPIYPQQTKAIANSTYIDEDEGIKIGWIMETGVGLDPGNYIAVKCSLRIYSEMKGKLYAKVYWVTWDDYYTLVKTLYFDISKSGIYPSIKYISEEFEVEGTGRFFISFNFYNEGDTGLFLLGINTSGDYIIINEFQEFNIGKKLGSSVTAGVERTVARSVHGADTKVEINPSIKTVGSIAKNLASDVKIIPELNYNSNAYPVTVNYEIIPTSIHIGEFRHTIHAIKTNPTVTHIGEIRETDIPIETAPEVRNINMEKKDISLTTITIPIMTTEIEENIKNGNWLELDEEIDDTPWERQL